MKVVKRDGQRTETFDSAKVIAAITKAWKEVYGGVSGGNEFDIELITMDVVAEFEDKDQAGVEEIQDVVEKALMRHGYYSVAKAYILYREERSKARADRTNLVPDDKAISNYIHAAKYARYLPEIRRRETYEETVARVEGMHLKKFPHMAEDIRWAFDMVRQKRVLPSMRSMQFAGEAIEQKNERIFNCTNTHIDRLEAFSQGLYLLLCGCGVGYSVQKHHVEKLPAIGYVDEKKVRHHVIDDSIEGWAEALKALLQSFIDGVNIEFAYHQIRPVGAILKTSGGRAPGHLKLKESLERIRGVLKGAQGRKLRPIECHRIMCHAADAVLSGGVRRSAMICLFSLDDVEMMTAKTGNWWQTEPWFANANNSVVLKRDEVTEEVFKSIFEKTKSWGEPGFFFVNDYEYGTNPCVPAGTRILTPDGYVPIESRVGQWTEVWNGLTWSRVTPQITGKNQPMVRVHLSDGTSLACTEYHGWILKGGQRVRARDLVQGDIIEKFSMPVIGIEGNLPTFRSMTEHLEQTLTDNNCLYFSSNNRDELLQLRTHMTLLGVQGHIKPDFIDGGWSLFVSPEDTYKLHYLGLYPELSDVEQPFDDPGPRRSCWDVEIQRIENLPRAETVYCFKEPHNGTGTFEGIVTGQCAEILLNPKLGDETGYQFCNLVEINAAKFKSREDFFEAARAATLIGTLQAAYTNMPYLGRVSEELTKREALLGVSMTGMFDAPHIACDPNLQNEIAQYVVEWNEEYARRIGINPAARTTCIKPAGTSSIELGGVSSGHHPHHAKRYIRRVTADEHEPLFQAFKAVNPHMCVRKPDGKWVIEFPVQAPEGAITKADISAIQFLEMVKSTQQNWVIPGTAYDTYSPGANHNVSNTVVVKPHEWDEVADYLWKNREFFTGVSLLPSTGDKDYAFAPMEEISTPEDEIRWKNLIENYRPVDYSAIIEENDETNLTGEAACAGGMCEIT